MQYAAHGRPAEPAPVTTPLDFGLLARHARIPVDEAELRSVFGHPGIFGRLASLSEGGHHEDTLVEHLPDTSVLFLWP